MKILYDHLCFGQKYGGVSKYFVNMLKALPNDVQYQISIKYSDNEYIKELPDIITKKLFGGIHFRGKIHIINAINASNSVKNIKKGNYDIYHPTHYNTYLYKYIHNKKVVCTFHDMNCYCIPEFYRSKYYSLIKIWQRKSAFLADKIIAVSKNTKKDIVRIFGVPERKIEVIYHGIDSIDIEKHEKHSLFDQPYILYVGTRAKYKNFTAFLKVFRLLIGKHPDISLVCTGIPFSMHELSKIHDYRLDDKVFQIFASESEMTDLYAGAEYFVYPSFYEGFGIPILEAFSCACPVLCSNTSCFPEVAGDAALYFDPYSIDDMLEASERLLLENDLKQSLIKKGKLRVKKFTWKKCAEEHIRVYKSLL